MWSSPPETLSLLWPSLSVPVAYAGLLSWHSGHLSAALNYLFANTEVLSFSVSSVILAEAMSL